MKIDGYDLRDLSLKGLREQIGYVLQDTALFHGTIAENIAFGRPGASREEIIKAAELANADEFISKMPQGYDTRVEERGSTLSGVSGSASGSRECWCGTIRSSSWMNPRRR